MTQTECAIEYYRLAFNGDPRTAVARFVGDTYIQHNPLVADNPEGFINYFERMHREFPNKSVRFIRSVEEGNLVALHTHEVWEGDGEYVTMDFLRFDENGKICEHWDAIQQIPAQSANPNTMY